MVMLGGPVELDTRFPMELDARAPLRSAARGPRWNLLLRDLVELLASLWSLEGSPLMGPKGFSLALVGF